MRPVLQTLLCIFLLGSVGTLAQDGFSVASYNLENYIDVPGNRPMKSAEAKARIRTALQMLKSDIVALQEVGGTNALLELQSSLKAEGLNYPFVHAVAGHDTNIHVAILSRFRIVRSRSHTDDSFLLHGRRFHVTRGFEETVFQVSPQLEVTVLNAHLKSRRPVGEADESELREQEALILREKIDALLRADPALPLLVVGDFNDHPSARSIRSIIGRGKLALNDARPAERNGDTLASLVPGYNARNVVWTHYFGKEDSYSRADYILFSKTLEKRFMRAGTYVLAFPNWGLASDHRPLVVRFALP